MIRDHKKGTRIEITDAKCQGLQFRLTDDAAIWTVRARLFDKQRRWTIGNSDVSPEDARERAGEVRAWCRRGSNPDKLVTQYMTGISMAKQIHFSAERPAPSWDWQKAVDNFLDHIRTKRAPDTYDDYARTLGGRMRLDPTKRHAQVAELSRFKGKQGQYDCSRGHRRMRRRRLQARPCSGPAHAEDIGLDVVVSVMTCDVGKPPLRQICSFASKPRKSPNQSSSGRRRRYFSCLTTTRRTSAGTCRRRSS